MKFVRSAALHFFAVVGVDGRISPGLHPASDKQFFGKDYPDDGHPFDVTKQGFKPPYPSVQDSDVFDKDYVKDENRDNGEWQAQMEFDMLRAKVRRAKETLARAEGKAKGEKAAYDEAYRKAVESGMTAAEAHKKAQAARDRYKDAVAAEKAAESEAANLRGKAGHLSPGMVDESDLKAAQDAVAKEEFQFKICQEQLEKAKANLEKAKADAAAKEKEEGDKVVQQQRTLDEQAEHDAAEGERLKGEVGKASLEEQAALKEEGAQSAAQATADRLAADALKRQKLAHMSVEEMEEHLDTTEDALRVAEYVLKYFRQHGGPPASIPDGIRHHGTKSSSKAKAANMDGATGGTLQKSGATSMSASTLALVLVFAAVFRN